MATEKASSVAIEKTSTRPTENSERWTWTRRKCPIDIIVAEEAERERRMREKPSDTQMLSIKKQLHEELLTKSSTYLDTKEPIARHCLNIQATLQNLRRSRGHQVTRFDTCNRNTTCLKEIHEAEEAERERRLKEPPLDLEQSKLRKKMHEELLNKITPVENTFEYNTSPLRETVRQDLTNAKPYIQKEIEKLNEAVTQCKHEVGEQITGKTQHLRDDRGVTIEQVHKLGEHERKVKESSLADEALQQKQTEQPNTVVETSN